jgi:hypothetical protein
LAAVGRRLLVHDARRLPLAQKKEPPTSVQVKVYDAEKKLSETI